MLFWSLDRLSATLDVIELTRFNDQLIADLASRHERLNLLYLDNAIYRNVIDQNRYRPQMRSSGSGSANHCTEMISSKS